MKEQARVWWTLPDGGIASRADLLALWHRLGDAPIPLGNMHIVNLDEWFDHAWIDLDDVAAVVAFLDRADAAHNSLELPFETLAKPPVGHAPTNRVGGRPRAVFDVEKAVALHKEGLGVERIAARLSVGGTQYVSATTVWRRLRDLAH